MSPRIGMFVSLGACAVWSCICGWIGYSLRDGRADTAAGKVEVAAQTGRANVIEQARAADHANEEHAATVERGRIQDAREIEVTFKTIETKAKDYAIANPAPAGCALTDDGLRSWAAANAGRFPATAEPGDIP